jgi:hypothetical protein
MYDRLATDEDIFKLVANTVYKSFPSTCASIRRLDESIEFQDLVQEIFLALSQKAKTRCIYVYQIRSLTGSYLSNYLTKLKIKDQNFLLNKEKICEIYNGGDIS